MAIIDMDSHLRDGWLLDEIYRLPEPFANYSLKRIGAGKYFLFEVRARSFTDGGSGRQRQLQKAGDAGLGKFYTSPRLSDSDIPRPESPRR